MRDRPETANYWFFHRDILLEAFSQYSLQSLLGNLSDSFHTSLLGSPLMESPPESPRHSPAESQGITESLRESPRQSPGKSLRNSSYRVSE